MKLFKRKNLMGLIYGIFVLLPFCAILSRVIYVQSNKNAYESYSGITKVTQTYVEQVEEGEQYKVAKLDDVPFTTTGVLTGTFEQFACSNSAIQNFFYNNYSNITTIKFAQVNQAIQIQFYNNSTYLDYWTMNANVHIQFIFNCEDTQQLNNNTILTSNNIITSNLDNVFEYSVNKFIDDNNFGKMDFFQWFSTLFLDSNAVNNMYVHFVNWYMNYLLYVSLGYLIFSVLMWFVNFFRGLVEKSTELNL